MSNIPPIDKKPFIHYNEITNDLEYGYFDDDGHFQCVGEKEEKDGDKKQSVHEKIHEILNGGKK